MNLSAKAMLTVWMLSAAASAQADLSVTYRNNLDLPSQVSDQSGQVFTVTGLSGLTALPDGRFAAVMDNSNHVVFFRPTFNADGSLASLGQATGLTLSASRDFEDIAWLPGTGSAILCDEGASSQLSVADLATGQVTPGPAMPAIFANVRANLGLESVTVSADGLNLWTCNEEALTTDGSTSTPSAGTRVRIQRFSRASASGTGGFTQSGQWAYLTESMHGLSMTNARSGVSALVALPGGGLLALERSFAFSSAGLYKTRIYSVTTGGAMDIGGAATLPFSGMTFCPKTTRFADYLYNVEGLALGPVVTGGAGVPAGRRVLLAITDDGDPLSSNRVHALSIDGLTVACGQADMGSQGGAAGSDGALDNNDFVVFIDRFFQQDSAADLGRQGGVSPGDGAFDNNDFVVFIDRFFTGC